MAIFLPYGARDAMSIRKTALTNLLKVRRSIDPAIAGFNEFDTPPTILDILFYVCGHGWRLEIIKRHEEFDRAPIVFDHVLKQEIIDIAFEISKQREEVDISCKDRVQGARLVEVVTPNTFQSEVKPVRDFAGEAARTINGGLALYPVSREDHHATYCVPHRSKGLIFFFGKKHSDVLKRFPPGESWNN